MKNVDDLYPLSPMQEGMLSHSLREASGDLYFRQLSCRLGGELDIALFQRAWRHAVDRHAILRTAFLWEGLDRPLQVVRRRVALPFGVHDLRGLTAGARARAVAEYLEHDRRRGFALNRAPLMRWALFREEERGHRLVWTFHHLLLDGWSRGLLWREVLSVYRGLRDGRMPDLPRVPPFRDFIAWLESRESSCDRSFWRRRLTGYDVAAPVVSPRPEGERATVRAGVRDRRTALPRAATAALEARARERRLTLKTLVHGAWARLLQLHNGADDVVFGTVLLGRSAKLEGVDALLGMLINTLPLRLEATPEAPLGRWLEEAQERLAELDRRAHESLVEVQAASEIPPGQPLFDSIVVFQPRLAAGLEEGGPAVSELRLERETTNYPLCLNALPGPRLELQLVYDGRRLESTGATRRLEHLSRLLTRMADGLDRPLAELSMLSRGEHHQLLAEWNDTRRGGARAGMPGAGTPGAGSPSAGSPVGLAHELFEARAERQPGRVAVRYGDRELTYGELSRRAEGLARRLRHLGVGPERLVGLSVAPGLDLPVALLAVWKAGGAYLPLDADFPRVRLDFMLADAGVSLLLTDAEGASGWSVFEGPTVVVGSDEAPEPEEDGRARRSSGSPDGLAYVIYTSGSTGRPKGVQITHRSLVNFLGSMSRRPGVAAGDRLLAVTSLSFDISALEILLPLVVGAEVELVDRETATDGLRLAERLAGPRVAGPSHMQATPSTWSLLLASGWQGGEDFTALCGGEAMPPSLAAELAGRCGDVWNLYGPTETTIWSSVDRVVPPHGATVPVGRPIDGTAFRVVSWDLRLQAAGTPGELAIAGAGLARGYRGRPGLTAESFVPDPFAATPGARLYRTGDLARWRRDGRAEILGRRDHQVKVRGHRIELGEIEAALLDHPAVRESAVRPWGSGEEIRLIAYPVLSGEGHSGESLSDELRRHLRRGLPDYMVPADFVVLDALPLTPNRKVDRKALPEPAVRTRTSSAAEPETATEKALAALWRELLGCERIGADDHFFELGGHSLLAFRMVSRVRRELGVELPMGTVFDAPRLRPLAERLEYLRRSRALEEHEALTGIVPRPEQRHLPFPLTDVQEAYWLGRQDVLELGSVATHGYLEIDFCGLDPERLSRAWRRLIARHDMLRAVVPDGDTQRVLPEDEVPPYEIAVIDLRDEGPEAASRRLLELREAMSHQVLATDRWPLFDLRLSLLDGERCRLHLSVDALIRDAWSNRILWRELEAFYVDPGAEPAPLELSFRDCVLAFRELRGSDLYARDLDYWRGRELPPRPELPLARDPSDVTSPRFVRRSGVLSRERWQSLQERAAGAGLTPSGVLLAVYAEILGTWSKSPRFTLNLTLFNRLPVHPQVEEVVGDFTSVTLLEVDRTRPEPFADRARRLQRRLWQDLDHRLVSGIELLRRLGRDRGSSRQALMPVVFTGALDAGERVPDRPEGSRTPQGDAAAAAFATAERGFTITQTPQVWLDEQVAVQDGELVYSWDAVEELFPEGLLDDMFEAHERLLTRLADCDRAWEEGCRPHLPTRQLERRAAINATKAPVPGGLLHDPFVAQAREHPVRAAVVAPDRTLTYGELLAESRALGARLRGLGARRNGLVAVVLEKGWEQVVAVLGVLASGAAYLPVDPALPWARRRELLELGEVEIAVTREALARELEWPSSIRPVAVDAATAPAGDGDGNGAEARPGDLAYVIFTSGSTGRPKGVMIDHRGALNTVVDVNRRFDVVPRDRVLALSSLSFDLSVYDLFGTLAAGAALVMPDPGGLRDPAHWVDLMARHEVSIWNSVPALMEMLVEAASSAPSDLSALRLVLLSGDWIPVTLPNRLRAVAAGSRQGGPRVGGPPAIVSLGGATEASIWSVLYPIAEVPPEWTSVPYGRPMVNQTLHVLDGDLEPRPVWTPGDLYIGGVGVALGYWRDPETTAASFLVLPRTGERIYRTGDLGRYLPSGDIEFLGREDFQVKIRGHRIELGEIEAALGRIAGVRAAAVLAAGDRDRRSLVAFVVPDSDPAALGEDTAGLLDRILPAPPAPSWVADVDGAGVDISEGHLATADGAAAVERLDEELERLRFRAEQPGLRRDLDGRSSVELYRPPEDGRLTAAFERRRSHREFDREPLPLASLGRALEPLRDVSPGDPRRLYPSMGSRYAVETMVLVREGRVAGAAAGLYSYDPLRHDLTLVSGSARVSARSYAEHNRPIFERSAFAVLLVARGGAADRPSDEVLLPEAGAMGQLLMEEGPAHDLGFCPIGGMDFDTLREQAGRGADLTLLHHLLGGGIAGQRSGAAAAPDRPTDREVAELPPGSVVELDAAAGTSDRGAPARGTPDRGTPDRGTPDRGTPKRRGYLDQALPAEVLGSFLSQLRFLRRPGASFPKYRYPSAGDLYPVQVYLDVRPERVGTRPSAGLDAGLYYYDPGAHRLVHFSASPDRPSGYQESDRELAEGSAFSIFLVSRPRAVDPIYGPELGRRFCLLEAGYMMQLLLLEAGAAGLGVSPLGSVRFAEIAPHLDLEPEQRLLGGLVGGLLREVDVTATGRPRAGLSSVAAEEAGTWIQERLRRLLPGYMVPADVVLLDEMPLTANGKVDRTALMRRAGDRPMSVSADADLEPPATEMERLVADAWREILECGEVGRHQDFFELGGISISAIRLVNLLRSRFELELPLNAVFEAPTVAELAEVVASTLSENIDEGDLNEALAELEGLSEEELRELKASGGVLEHADV